MRSASPTATSENAADICESLGDLAFSCELKRLGAIALRVLSALASFEQTANTGNKNLKKQVAEFESRLIRSALVKTGGNQRRAAQVLGIKNSTLNAKIKRYGIDLVSPAE